MKKLSSCLLALLALPALVIAQTGPSKTPTPGAAPKTQTRQEIPIGQLRVTGRVHVGEGAPDFTATSTSGREVALSRLKGDWLVLVFAEYREDFAPLRDIHDDLARAGARIFGVCKEKPQRLRAIAERDSLPFELLADDTGEISAIYGHYDLSRRATTPGFVLLDRQGVVRMALEGQAPPLQVAELSRFTIVGF